MLGRPNLRLETKVHVERVTTEGRRATGIVFRRDGQSYSAKASGEVVLSAGAVMSPVLLELSGIGDGERLRQLGVPAVVDVVALLGEDGLLSADFGLGLP